MNKKYKILLLCCISYTLSYICRTNLSVALGYMLDIKIITESQSGIVSMIFFWIYAAGQILSGMLTEKFKPKKMITTGIFISIAANFAIGFLCFIKFSSFFPVLAILWSINAFAQSLLWCPIYKIVTDTFEPEEYRRVSVYISYPTTIGFLLSWGVLGSVISVTGYQYAFIIPAALMSVFVIIWILKLKPPEKKETIQENIPVSSEQGEPVQNEEGNILFSDREFYRKFLISIVFFGIICFIQGFIKENVNFWTPSLLLKIGTGEISPSIITMISTFIPIAGTIGIAFSAILAKRFKNSNFLMLFVIFIITSIFCLLLYFTSESFFAVVIFTGLIMMLLCCSNVILTAYVPLDFVKYKRSAQMSGLLNFIVYAGAGIGNLITGLTSENSNSDWSSVYLIWVAISVLAIAALTLQKIISHKRVL